MKVQYHENYSKINNIKYTINLNHSRQNHNGTVLLVARQTKTCFDSHSISYTLLIFHYTHETPEHRSKWISQYMDISSFNYFIFTQIANDTKTSITHFKGKETNVTPTENSTGSLFIYHICLFYYYFQCFLPSLSSLTCYQRMHQD